MDLKRLRYFVTVAELGSFTLGARHLGIAQPALSRHIRQLENECGAPLLRRTGRGAQLNDVGKIVFEHARSLLEQVDRLETGLKAAKGAPTGNVILGLPPSVCLILVEPLFHRVRQDFPGIRLQISEAFSGDVREWLVGAARYRGLVQSRACRPSGWQAPSGGGHVSLLRRGGRERRAAAQHHVGGRNANAFDPPQPSTWSAHPRRYRLREAGLTPDVVLELDSMATIKDLVRSADAATILPFCGVYREVEQGHLVARRIVALVDHPDADRRRNRSTAENAGHHAPWFAVCGRKWSGLSLRACGPGLKITI